MKPKFQHCCASMRYYLNNSSGANGIEFVPKFREYGITVPGQTTSITLIEFCPWCGTKLPSTLRMQWFERIDELGIDEAKDPVPKELQTDAWYLKSRRAQRRKKPIANLIRSRKHGVPRRVLKFDW
jgi:hypothetical protein